MNQFQIKLCEDRSLWEDFLQNQERTPFLQSWNSGVHYELEGNHIFRLGIYKDNVPRGICLVIKIQAKRGNYLYIPYGPILTSPSLALWRILTAYLVRLGKEQKVNFIKISPYIEKNRKLADFLKKLGYLKSQIHVLSEVSRVLNLEGKTESELLGVMRKTTRNLIRRAKKEGVKIIFSKELNAVDSFYRLYEQTGKRHGFVLYPKSFIENQIKAYGPDNQVVVALAQYQSQVISSAVIMFYGKEAAYHHGASSLNFPKIPASYLLQWEAIRLAQKRGFKYYNFWGIYEGENPKHPFLGITHFKKGFGGESRYWMPCHDLPINKKYWINYWVEKIRRIKRGF